MLKTGLVSVTFRNLGVEDIAKAANKASLDCIEWGGDVHVPPLDESAASLAKKVSLENGIRIASYGSYYRCLGTDEEAENEIKTAAMLGAPNIRIWAGKLWSNDYDDAGRKVMVDSIRRVCVTAAKYGITVSPEFHQATLTDTYKSAVQLIEEVAEENFRMYWQPNQFEDDEYNLNAIKAVLPYLSNVHVFSWSGNDKFPLVDGERMWKQYLDIIRSDGKDHNLLLEFVCDGTVEQLYRDAETLHEWIK